MPTSAAQTYQEFKTPDGRWTFGYGQYEMTMAKLGVAPASAPSTVTSAWPTMAVISDAFAQAAAASAASVAAKTGNTQCYYIFVIDPNGQKRIVAEWTLLQGGRSARDAYFNGSFEPAMLTPGVSDVVRINNTFPATAAAPGLPVVDVLKKALIADVEAAASGSVTGLLIVGGLILGALWWLGLRD